MMPDPRVSIATARLVYTQEPDSDDDDRFGPQILTVEAVDAGGGPYLVLSTQRWAVDSPAEMLPLLERALSLMEPTDA